MSKKETQAQTKKVDAIPFQNQYLADLVEWLNIPLHSEKARARNRIIELVQQKYETFEADRIALVKKHAELDKDKNPIMETVFEPATQSNVRRYKIKEANIAKFNTEFDKLKKEDAIFDILPSNREHWRMVRKIFAESKKEMDIEMTKFWELVVDTLANV